MPRLIVCGRVRRGRRRSPGVDRFVTAGRVWLRLAADGRPLALVDVARFRPRLATDWPLRLVGVAGFGLLPDGSSDVVLALVVDDSDDLVRLDRNSGSWRRVVRICSIILLPGRALVLVGKLLRPAISCVIGMDIRSTNGRVVLVWSPRSLRISELLRATRWRRSRVVAGLSLSRRRTSHPVNFGTSWRLLVPCGRWPRRPRRNTVGCVDRVPVNFPLRFRGERSM